MTAPYTGEDRRLIQRAGDEATERVWADRRMQERLSKLTAERDQLREAARAAMNLIGAQRPCQASVEVFQLLQAAVEKGEGAVS